MRRGPKENAANEPMERQVDISTLPDALKKLWYVASCLSPGAQVMLQLGSNGISGFTRAELKELERHCFSRETVTDSDPPLHMQFSRDENGKTFLRLLRWSATENKWKAGFYLGGNPLSFQGAMLLPGEDEFTTYILPILRKLEAVSPKIVKNITRDKPNHVLYRQFFTTYPDDAYWMQLNSPEAPDIHRGVVYRLYVHPQIRSVEQYIDQAKQVARLAREYNRPLVFKMMHSGPRAGEVILDPDSSKICFYFREQQEAVRFGNYLNSHLSAQNGFIAPRIPLKERFEPQKVWQNGLLVMGKGTREERREVRRKLDNINNLRTQVRQDVLRQARDLSMTL